MKEESFLKGIEALSDLSTLTPRILSTISTTSSGGEKEFCRKS